jgi:hypothetical protein
VTHEWGKLAKASILFVVVSLVHIVLYLYTLQFLSKGRPHCVLCTAANMGASQTKPVLAASAAASTMSFYSLSTIRSDGSTQPMEEFKGKVIYATNVASH